MPTINISTLKFPKNYNFWTDFHWTVFLRPKTALIVIVAP